MSMEFTILILNLSLFVALYLTIKLLVDARNRNRLVSSDRSDETIKAYLKLERRLQRLSSLRFGLVLVCLASGLGIIQITGLEERASGISMAALGILVGATGAGNLLYFVIETLVLKEKEQA